MADRKKVIIVEDEEVLRRILVDFLKKETDWEIIEAMDGEEGLELIKKNSPDVAVLDIFMPKMDGIVLVKKLNDEKLNEKMKIIFLTNSGNLSDISSIMSPSVAGYLIKANIDMQDVLEKIKTIIGA